jgi:glycerol-3-phosphate dehydrogenase subunit B
MAIEDDVLVIGGGIAAASAALAAREQGVRVRLLAHKQSTLRQASGLIDVLGHRPAAVGDGDADAAAPIVDPFEAIEALPEGHPYERVGVDAVRAGLDLFDDAVGDAYAGGHTDRNALVPTHGGTVKPTARYPTSAAAGLASVDRDALLVGLASLTGFDGPMAADHLQAAGVPFDSRGATIEFPGDLRDDAKLTRYAHLLDRNDEVTVDGRKRPMREALAERVKDRLDGEQRVGFPAVLGDDRPADVRADLSERLAADVFEVPMGPPSLPGLRLSDALFAALEDAGVRVTTGNPVVDFEADGDRIDRVIADHTASRVPYSAEQYVLATGGLVGKGVQSDRERVYEPIFDLPIPQPSDRYDWFEDSAFDDHPFARFGVSIDRETRPLGSEDDPAFDNLRAAGSVVGGYDFAAEKSGAGVSLATGYAAGTGAGEQA